jgi:hypothetical protein
VQFELLSILLVRTSSDFLFLKGRENLAKLGQRVTQIAGLNYSAVRLAQSRRRKGEPRDKKRQAVPSDGCNLRAAD